MEVIQSFFALLRSIVWTAVIAILMLFGSIYAVYLGDQLLVLALAVGANTFALLSLRARS